ncbi:MAG TPA: hypothetical protein ENH41_01080 [Candidatus Omnitrophica bacterium]|nr:hypothetical protein [Candidatus Omnitrophota bacterium]
MQDDKVISSWEFKEQLKGEKSFKLYSGIEGIDRLIDGFEPGELYVLSGATKHGKSTVFQMLTQSFEQNEIYSLWFSYEIPARQLITRFKNLPLFYLPQKLKGNVITYLKAKIIEAKANYAVRIVFIDHLHYLLDLAKMRNPSLEIGKVIRDLKTLAIEQGVIIFLACHLTKLQPDKEPTAADMRDSSFMAQESDCVMILWRTKNSINTSRLKIEFHRRIGIIEKTVDLIYVDGELKENVWIK